MQNKEELTQAIREFVTIDNEMKVLAAEITKRRRRKAEISQSLIDTMRDHKIGCFEMQTGKILYDKRSVKKPLTQKRIWELVHEFYADDTNAAVQLSNFLQEHREEVVKETIVRKDQKGATTAAALMAAATAASATTDNSSDI